MSGICGIFNRDGTAVEPAVLQRMAQAAAHLGPDGVRYWSNGPVGLAHLALCTTAESCREQQPSVARHGDLVLVADARVDNRDELIHTLTAEGSLQQRDPTDAELILAAYQAWGEGCPYHILGDFAFVLWDEREQRLFCARDPFGVRPLFYHVDGRVFLFGSMVRQVLAHGAVAARLNERAIAYYLTGRPYNFPTEGTYFEGIWRVRPAHTLALTPSGEPRQTRYWDIERARQPQSGNDQTYAEECRHLLEQAVKAQSRSERPLAVLTSGGMDSSSVACLLGKLRQENHGVDFDMVSVVFGKGHPSDEREYIHQIAMRYGTTVRYIDGLKHPPFSYSRDEAEFNDEPPSHWNEPMQHAAFALVAQLGRRVTLLGQGGDCLFTVHSVLFGDLMHRGKLLECAREILAIPAQYRSHVAPLICTQWVKALAPMPLLRLHRKLRAMEPAWVNMDTVGPLVEDAPAFRWGFPDYGFSSVHQATRYYAVSDWLYPVEASMHRLATGHGVEPRDPYLYRPLVEFALHLPVKQVYYRARTKRVLRNAMVGVLPDKVRLRVSETVFQNRLRQGLRSRLATGVADSLSRWTSVKRGYVRAEQLSRTMQGYCAVPTSQVENGLWRALLLERWLDSVQSVIGS